MAIRYQTELCPLPLRPREEPSVDALEEDLGLGVGVSGIVDIRELLRDTSSGRGVGSTICNEIKVSSDAEASGCTLFISAWLSFCVDTIVYISKLLSIKLRLWIQVQVPTGTLGPNLVFGMLLGNCAMS